MQLSLTIQEGEAQIAKLIIDAIRAELNSVLLSASTSIQQRARKLFEERLIASETWRDLDGGELQGELGIPLDVKTRLHNILLIWLQNIIVNYIPLMGNANGLRGGIKLNMLKSDWSDVINSPDASIITDRGGVLWWLEWLLTYGSQIIVKEYDVVASTSPRSRSGMALMFKHVKRGYWMVPPRFQGTTNNNFVTQVLDTMDNDIENIIEDEITKRLM